MLKSKRAFTLIEVLIAVTISIVVIASAYTVFFAVKRGAFDVYDSMRNKERVYNLFSMMRKEMESIYYEKKLKYSGVKIEENDYYGNPASKITFTTFFKDGLKVISYFVEEEKGNLNLYKRLYDPLMEDRPIKVLVLRDIKGFKVSHIENGEEKKVFDSQSAQKNPEYIKVSIFFKKNDGEAEELSQICKLMVER
ncbi:MAG: type II secretion system GspH family protein [Proteobacteria bacterium]|nr:type II secretion system GspH family protein [Pseudomonadota bacterium]